MAAVLEAGSALVGPLPPALNASTPAPSEANYVRAYTSEGASPAALGKRYRFPGEECAAAEHCHLNPVPPQPTVPPLSFSLRLLRLLPPTSATRNNSNDRHQQP